MPTRLSVTTPRFSKSIQRVFATLYLITGGGGGGQVLVSDCLRTIGLPSHLQSKDIEYQRYYMIFTRLINRLCDDYLMDISFESVPDPSVRSRRIAIHSFGLLDRAACLKFLRLNAPYLEGVLAGIKSSASQQEG